MRESVIEFAEKRMAEEDRAGEEQNTLYWAAYLDGAKAQLKEDLKALLDYEKLKKQTQIASDTLMSSKMTLRGCRIIPN